MEPSSEEFNHALSLIPKTMPLGPALQFTEILKLNGITQPISDLTVDDADIAVGNCSCVAKTVTVNFEDDREEPIHLFVKIRSDGEDGAEVKGLLQEFRIEAVFLMEYLPMAREYCESVRHGELMNIYPKCYHGDDEMIMLEDLVVGKGLFQLEKEEFHDFETAKVALVALVKHHAISQSVIRNMGGMEKFLERFPTLETCQTITDSELDMSIFSAITESIIDINIYILETCMIEGSAETIEKLKVKKGKAFDEILESIKVTDTEEEFLVLLHGEYFNDNMMFVKDKETSEIMDLVMIDFQCVWYGSHCHDIANYFFTSLRSEVRRGRFRELLTVYRDSLKGFGAELGYQTNITIEQLESDFCKHFYIGYWMNMDQATTGEASEVMKDLPDIDGEDISKQMEAWHEFMTKWVEEHPEECKVKAQNIIDYVKDYEQFSTGQIP